MPRCLKLNNSASRTKIYKFAKVQLKLILASGVCLLCVILAVRTFIHARAGNRPPISSAVVANNDKWADIKMNADAVDLDMVPTADTINESAQTIAETLRCAISANKGHGKPAPHEATILNNITTSEGEHFTGDFGFLLVITLNSKTNTPAPPRRLRLSTSSKTQAHPPHLLPSPTTTKRGRGISIPL